MFSGNFYVKWNNWHSAKTLTLIQYAPDERGIMVNTPPEGRGDLPRGRRPQGRSPRPEGGVLTVIPSEAGAYRHYYIKEAEKRPKRPKKCSFKVKFMFHELWQTGKYWYFINPICHFSRIRNSTHREILVYHKSNTSLFPHHKTWRIGFM